MQMPLLSFNDISAHERLLLAISVPIPRIRKQRIVMIAKILLPLP